MRVTFEDSAIFICVNKTAEKKERHASELRWCCVFNLMRDRFGLSSPKMSLLLKNTRSHTNHNLWEAKVVKIRWDIKRVYTNYLKHLQIRQHTLLAFLVWKWNQVYEYFILHSQWHIDILVLSSVEQSSITRTIGSVAQHWRTPCMHICTAL